MHRTIDLIEATPIEISEVTNTTGTQRFIELEQDSNFIQIPSAEVDKVASALIEFVKSREGIAPGQGQLFDPATL